MTKLREQLEASGCSVIDETEGRIVVSCPRVLLKEGLRVEGAKNIQTQSSDEKRVILVIEKEAEGD
jgi:hypothetical protein